MLERQMVSSTSSLAHRGQGQPHDLETRRCKNRADLLGGQRHEAAIRTILPKFSRFSGGARVDMSRHGWFGHRLVFPVKVLRDCSTKGI